ncbi:Proline iminopeptidase (plasmid) [Mesomycoplasma conjunctivae]|nr:prolyl aminopeptidase [Mycoplasmopsis fermentans]ADV34815.1 Proline iminopeptidase [Mycoplasmopsis fermentans M64]VEU63717.1 Proline iminopeptidase [Mycoplasmopsis fermentans]VEU67294.1 Proline iminopeptidase [Mesomycoplasma conjunctivae]
MYKKYLYPKIEPYQKGYLKVDDIYQIYYEVSGNPQGQPIVYVHGGPGGGTSEVCRRYFDPKYYKIVLFDQRGCGKSTPSLELKNNTTWDLINDMEAIRKELKIDKWILFGGSWGTTLSLSYAINHSDKVDKLILRSIFLGRQSDIDWLYQEGASYFKPEAYERYTSFLSDKERKNIVNAYYKHIHSTNKELRHKALIEWTRWESSLVLLKEQPFKEPKKPKWIYEISLIENYYFYNKCFFEENYILNNINKIKDVETYIVHGQFDLDCRPSGAYELHQKLNNSHLIMVEKAAHSQREVNITKALVKITDQIRKK